MYQSKIKKLKNFPARQFIKNRKFAMKKKAQVQIFETIVVVLVFFILIAISFILYGKLIRGNLETYKEESAQSNSISIVQRIMFMPELQCSNDNIIRENCIDKLKMESAKNIISKDQNQIYYYDLLEFSDIKVRQIYPEDKNWELYSNRLTNFKNKFTTNVPISIYNPDTKLYGFGILTIETFTR